MVAAAMNDLLQQLGTTFGWLSLLQFGGTNAVVPEMHRQAVDVFHWMDARTFANLFALAQLAPGPNVMIVSLVGWQVAGLSGLVTATLAMTVPPSLLAFAVSRLMLQAGPSRWLVIVKDGLVPVAIGMILASGAVIVGAASSGTLGIAITVGAALFIVFTDYNLLWALGAAIALGLLAQTFT
jgi:chromate transporter